MIITPAITGTRKHTPPAAKYKTKATALIRISLRGSRKRLRANKSPQAGIATNGEYIDQISMVFDISASNKIGNRWATHPREGSDRPEITKSATSFITPGV
jgi:hypothetical protein